MARPVVAVAPQHMFADRHHQRLERHGRLHSRGAPTAIGFINGVWSRCMEQPMVNGRPHYVKLPRDGDPTWPSDVACLRIFFEANLWRIASFDNQHIYGAAQSDAEHPNTVSREDWLILSTETRMLEPWIDFMISCEGPNTEEKPFLLEELGIDFFLRIQLKSRKVIWFTDPSTGAVYHSAAKSTAGEGGRMQPGKRYCHLCRKCISANNFQSQHLAHLHRPSQPLQLNAIPANEDMVKLQWTPPSRDGGLALTGYRLSISFDDGKTWTSSLDVDIEAVSAADPSSPSVSISLAQLNCIRPVGSRAPYRFAIAATNRAGIGFLSEPSPPVMPSQTSANESADAFSAPTRISRFSSMSERLSEQLSRLSAAMGMEISGRSSLSRRTGGERKTGKERFTSGDTVDMEMLEEEDDNEMRIDLADLLAFTSQRSQWKKMWPFCVAISAMSKGAAGGVSSERN
eukprot:scaffold1406_cov27-Tisochrysis_lutea.AAC.1